MVDLLDLVDSSCAWHCNPVTRQPSLPGASALWMGFLFDAIMTWKIFGGIFILLSCVLTCSWRQRQLISFWPSTSLSMTVFEHS